MLSKLLQILFGDNYALLLRKKLSMLNIFQINEESDESIQHSFIQIANTLMNDCALQVNEQFYRIVECEFYYNSNNHPDPFVHGHDLQKQTFGKWYFHGSGLDITLGNDKGYGGILLRGLARINKGSIEPTRNDAIFGPLKICTEIFSQFGFINIDRSLDFGFVIIGSDDAKISMPKTKVFAVKRIGLNPEKEQAKIFFNRPYRFVSYLHLPHKGQENMKNYLIGGSKPQLSKDDYDNLYKNKS